MEDNNEELQQCIYCLDWKRSSLFNREHVVSRMFGTYDNAYVLNCCEVCKDCNSFFSTKLENMVSMDSYEGLLRTQYLQRKHHANGRQIGRTRLFLEGKNELFNGLRLYVSENPNNPQNIQIEVAPAVGIIKCASRDEYNYYTLSEIPVMNDELRDTIMNSKTPIIVFGYSEEEVKTVLSSKGYDLTKAKYEGDLDFSSVTSETSVLVQIKSKVDNVLFRLAAKNVMNYCCYKFGKEFVLDNRFDNIRSFARYGNVKTSTMMCVNNGGIQGIPENVEKGHIIGTALTAVDTLYLCGFVSWFGAITYSFLIEKCPNIKTFPRMSFSICDNQNRIIKDYYNPVIVDWPNSRYISSIIGDEVRFSPKKL